MTKPKTAPRARKPKAAETVALNALKEWLASLDLGGVSPSVHVNGHQFALTSILTVDLGQPIRQVRLTADQSHMLGEHMKAAAREILGREANVRVHTDNSRGITWASLPMLDRAGAPSTGAAAPAKATATA